MSDQMPVFEDQYSDTDRGLGASGEAAGHATGTGAPCVTLDLVNFLLSRATMDEVAQYLVLQCLASLHPWQMSIYEVGSDSLLRLVGSFGQEKAKGDMHARSCLDDPLFGEDLRAGIPQANFALSPHNGGRTLRLVDMENGPQVLWPLVTSSRLCGVLQVRFHADPDPWELQRSMESIAPPVALVLDMMERFEDLRMLSQVTLMGADPFANASNGSRTALLANLTSVRPLLPGAVSLDGRVRATGPRGRAEGELTERQRQVLKLMADGMTNGQIARVLRFSESTVRQETMAIYRIFGVRGRAEAVEMGERLGMLGPEPGSGPALGVGPDVDSAHAIAAATAERAVLGT